MLIRKVQWCTIILQGVRKCSTQNEPLYDVFQHYFHLQRSRTVSYIEANKLDIHDADYIRGNIEYCLQLGYSTKNILDYPVLLRAKPSSLKQQYNVMTEGGFSNITPRDLSKFKTLCKRKVKNLKRSALINTKTDVTRSFIAYLDQVPKNFAVETDGNDEIWIDIHNKILTEYLKKRLKVHQSKIVRLLQCYPHLKRKSLRLICENIAMAEELGFDSEGILRYGNLLTHDPDYTKRTLELHPNLAGADMRKAMKMYPKLAAVPPKNFDKVYKVLKDHGISDEMIRNKMNVFQLAPDTINFRLQELKRTTDLKVLLSNPHILQLIVHHNRAKSRLGFMKQLHLKCAGVRILGNDDDDIFDNHIREGRDINKYPDVYKFIKGVFNKEPCEFQDRLKKHPFFLQVPLVLMDDTLKYLKELNFTSESIFKVISIILYPKNKIREGLIKVDSFKKDGNGNISEVDTLNLILYFIEKEHHFTDV